MCEELWNTLPYWCVERDVYMYHNIPLYVLRLVEIPLDVLRLVHRPTAVCVCSWFVSQLFPKLCLQFSVAAGGYLVYSGNSLF